MLGAKLGEPHLRASGPGAELVVDACAQGHWAACGPATGPCAPSECSCASSKEIRHNGGAKCQVCGLHSLGQISVNIRSCAGRLKRVIKHILPPAAGSAEPGIGNAISFIAAPKEYEIKLDTYVCPIPTKRYGGIPYR